MFEAKFEQAALLKKLLDSIKDLVIDANWDCSECVQLSLSLLSL